MEEKYLICEDSIEGIFTGIYDAYALREGHEHIHIQVGEVDNYRLFADYLYIQPDPVKTDKVAGTLSAPDPSRQTGDAPGPTYSCVSASPPLL